MIKNATTKLFLGFLLLSILMAFSTVALADGTCGANLTWKLKDGVLTISGTGDMEDWFISNPWKEEKDSITKVVIEEGVTSIGDFAFYSCGELVSVEIPEGVTRIGRSAFDWCRRLTSVTLPQSLTTIGDSAFNICEKLTNVVVPPNVTTIGESVFAQCENLASLTLPEGLTTIGQFAFSSCEKLQSITIPSTVTVIGNGGFNACRSLTEINVPDGSAALISIDGVLLNAEKTTLIAYPANKSQTTYSLPDGVTTIDQSAFYGNKNLTGITLPTSLIAIGDDAFYYCQKLTGLVIPEGVKSIGDTAFVGCSDLNSVSFPSTLESIGQDMFEYCSKLTVINVAENNQHFTAVDGVMFSADQTQLIAYPIGKQASTYMIPEGVTRIGDYAFLQSEYLKDVSFPEGLEMIGKSAFSGCELLTIEFPSSLTTIDGSAFSSNDVISQVTIPATVLTLGNGVFSWCDNLVSVTIEGMYTSLDKYGVFDFGNDNLIINGLAGSTAEIHAADEKIPFNVITLQASNGDAWTCPECQTTLDGGKFCPDCGAGKPTTPKCATCEYEPAEGETPKFCPECGTKFQ